MPGSLGWDDGDYGRHKWGRPLQRTTAVGATDVIIAPANPNRRAITISPPTGGANLFVSINRPASTTVGMSVPTGFYPLHFTRLLHGRLVEAEFHAVASAADNVTVWEVED